MLDKIILGLLQFGSHSSYSMQKTMEQSTSFFYGASQGSISPALKKLSASGLIEGAPKQDGRRKRVEYSITEQGQLVFDAWVGSDFTVGRVKDDALVRLFFLGHLAPEERKALIGQYCEDLRREKAVLEGLIHGVEQSLDGRLLTEVESFRMQTLRFGIEYYEFSIRWYEKLARDG